MGMSIEESLNNLMELQKDYQQFHDDVWQDPESYGIMAESLQVAIESMEKFQKIQEIMNELNGNFYGSNLKDRQTLEKIYEVLEDDI